MTHAPTLYGGDRMLIPILDDFYGVAKMLRDIDPDLYLAFNTAIERYEVHDRRAKPGHTLVMRVMEPDGSFRLPDHRVIETILKYRGRSVDDILREIDAQNERRQAEWEKRNQEIAEGIADDLAFAGKPVVQGADVRDAAGNSPGHPR